MAQSGTGHLTLQERMQGTLFLPSRGATILNTGPLSGSDKGKSMAGHHWKYLLGLKVSASRLPWCH